MLDRLQPELRDPLDLQSQMRMRLGQEVGQVVRGRFPGGKVGRVPGNPERSLQRTQTLIDEGVDVLYEATFQYDGVLIQADLLLKGDAGWRLYEVKSGSGVENHHLWDLAVQVYVVRGTGLIMEDASLIHVNSEYIRQGELDLGALFTEAPLMTDIDMLEDEVRRIITVSKDLLASGEIPERDIGPYCEDPDTCDFKGHCWAHLPSPSVFDVYRLVKKKKFALYYEGIMGIEDIPPEYPLPDSSRFHVEAQRMDRPIIDRYALMTFIEKLEYPLFFVDFETFSLPIPPYDGVRPYNQVPFQFSLHVRHKPAGDLEHQAYLAQPGIDPRPEFLTKLLEMTAGPGDLLVYNASFERGVLASLVHQFPEHQAAIESRISRLVDLLEPFRERMYYKSEMGSSYSLKSVLPALVPELTYDTLTVQDGTQAMEVFLNLSELEEPEQIEAQRQALQDYCELDTLAMVRILDALTVEIY